MSRHCTRARPSPRSHVSSPSRVLLELERQDDELRDVAIGGIAEVSAMLLPFVDFIVWLITPGVVKFFRARR
jgi:hypothetical protein